MGAIAGQDPKVAQVTRLAALAEQEIENHRKSVAILRKVSAELDRLSNERSARKTAAIVRLCEQDNPATPGKKYSPSQAADFAQLDREYAEYKVAVQNLTLMRQEAEGSVATAKLTAQLAVALFRAECGLTT